MNPSELFLMVVAGILSVAEAIARPLFFVLGAAVLLKHIRGKS